MPSVSHSEPRESRPAPTVGRPEPRETRPAPNVNRPEPAANVPAPRKPSAEQSKPAARVNNPEPSMTRPGANTNRPTHRDSAPTSNMSRPVPSSASNGPNTAMHSGGGTPREITAAPHSIGSAPTRLSPATTPQANRIVPIHNGGQARIDTRGRVTSLRDPARGITVNHGPHNVRVIESRRPDGTRMVAIGHGRGFVERPLAARPGYVARTYVVGGRPYVRVYHQSSFHGYVYHRYVPAVYYRPVFYQWAYNPWPAPIYFSWGWHRDPWYGYYGAYFTPAPVYTSPNLWLTDYLLAENLRLAYENQQQSGELPPTAQADQTVALSPEIKQVIAEEVKQQLAAEQAAAENDSTQDPSQAAASEEPPPALDRTQRVFVVSATLLLPGPGGQMCELTPGDVILRTADAIEADGTVAVNILSSKPGDCPINSSSTIEFATLQEMHNQFREQIDSGLTVLAANQGKGGLPKGPSHSTRPVTRGWAKADDKAESVLLEQQHEADQAEFEAQQLADNAAQTP